MDEAAKRGETPPAPSSEPDDVDRLAALEHQVRQLTSRLAGWVEAQLVQSLDDRRNEIKALRSELQVLLNEQLAGMRAESSSVLSVATRRLEVAQQHLAERLDTVAERAASAAEKVVALGGSSTVDSDRLDLLEQHFAQRLADMQEQTNAALAAVVERQQADGDMVRAEVTSGLTVLAGMPSAADAMEQRMGTALSRLNDSVESRLASLAQERQSELDNIKAEMQALVEERVSQSGDPAAGPARLEEFERRVKAAMGRLTDSVEAKLAETVATRESGFDALRSELTSRIDGLERSAGRVAEAFPALQLSVLAGDERTETVERETRAALDGVTASLETRLAELSASRDAALEASRAEMATAAEAATARANELEQRVKAAVARLAESVEHRLGEFATARTAEVEVATSPLRARLGQVQERIDTVEQQNRAAAARVAERMKAELAEVVERRRVELEALKAEIKEELAAQLREARGEIGMVVADAHRRFVVSVDQLEERMQLVAEQATGAWTAIAGIDALQETVISDGRRIEALETHTRRTDARLGDVVAAKLAEQAGEQGTQLEEVRDELGARVDRLQAQMRAALDAHLAESRDEVTSALSEGRAELAAGAQQLEALELALDQQSTKAVADLDVLRASVEGALKKAEERLGRTVQARLAESEAVAAQVANVQDKVQERLTAFEEQLEARARSSAAEAGPLAPLRSDLRMLQGQVAELAEAVADLRPKRKAAATPAKRALAAPARRAAAVPARRTAADPARKAAATPAKKAAATPTKRAAAAPVKKVAAKKAKRQ